MKRRMSMYASSADYWKAEAKANAKDAERYRYLRNRVPAEVLEGMGWDAGVWIDCETGDGTLTLLTGEDADASIDCAIAMKEKP